MSVAKLDKNSFAEMAPSFSADNMSLFILTSFCFLAGVPRAFIFESLCHWCKISIKMKIFGFEFDDPNKSPKWRWNASQAFVVVGRFCLSTPDQSSGVNVEFGLT